MDHRRLPSHDEELSQRQTVPARKPRFEFRPVNLILHIEPGVVQTIYVVSTIRPHVVFLTEPYEAFLA